MNGIRRQDNTNATIIRAISFTIILASVVAIVIAGYKSGDFLSAIHPKLLAGALSVLFVTSIVYTPFSYGISYYFLRMRSNTHRLSDVFYLFKTPRRLFRAIVCDTLRRLIITLIRLVILLVGAAFELLFITFGDPPPTLSVIVHIIAWSAVLFLMFIVKIRFILCKYVLINDPESRITDVFVTGLAAIRSHTPDVIRFYIKYLAVYIFTFVTLGLARARRVNKTRDSFCTFAVRLIKNV